MKRTASNRKIEKLILAIGVAVAILASFSASIYEELRSKSVVEAKATSGQQSDADTNCQFIYCDQKIN